MGGFVSITGLGGFGRLAADLAALASLPSRVARPIALALTKRLRAQFAAQCDPYGTPWKPLAQRTIDKKGHDLILDETGALRSGTKAVPLPGTGVALIVDPEYGAFHQTGNPPWYGQPNGMPARKILPEHGLPASWKADIAAAVKAQAKVRR